MQIFEQNGEKTKIVGYKHLRGQVLTRPLVV